MDHNVRQELAAQGLELSMEDELPRLPVCVDGASWDVLPPEQDGLVAVRSGDACCRVALQPIGRLFTGDARAPDLSTYPEAYCSFFAVLELTAANYCAATNRIPTDDEFARIYKQLRSKPDGKDRSPLFAYLQGAARVYMSVLDVSKHEFRAVVGQLAKSAKTYRLSKRSCNYFANVLGRFEPDRAAVLEHA